MASHRVHAATNKCRQDQISKRFPTEEVYQSSIKGELDSQIGELPHTRRFWFEEKRPESIKEELKDNPYAFGDGIRDKVGFREAGEIHVNSIVALESMVLEMILLEGDGHGYPNRKVSENPKPAIINWG